MEKMAWMADYSGVHYEVLPDTKKLIDEERARRRVSAWMTDDDGKKTTELSIVAAAVSAAVGLEAANNFGQTVGAPEKHFPGIIPVEPVTREEFRIPVFDYQAQIVRHQASVVRLDELTRLRARDEYEASKVAPAPVLEFDSMSPLQRSAAQDAAVLAEIRKQGCDPLVLPKNEPGKPGPKAAVREALRANRLFIGSTVFDKAWERLRKHKDIADKA